MATQYRIYDNDGAGGPIDYSSPAATVSGTTWLSPTLSAGGHYRFAVRTYDTVSGLEDDNGDAVVEIRLNASGDDVTAVPTAPVTLDARAKAGGTAEVGWTWLPRPGESAPTGYKVWVTSGTSVNYAAAASATVAHVGVGSRHSASVSGLTDGTTYAIGVRAYNAVGDELNTNKVTIVGRSTGAGAVGGLSGSGIGGTPPPPGP